MDEQKRFSEWAKVELFGHSEIVGFVTEQVIAGTAFLRVDVPQCGDIPEFTKYYGGAAVYAMMPTTEETARLMVLHLRVKPHTLYMPELYPQDTPRGLPTYRETDHETQFTDDHEREEDEELDEVFG